MSEQYTEIPFGVDDPWERVTTWNSHIKETFDTHLALQYPSSVPVGMHTCPEITIDDLLDLVELTDYSSGRARRLKNALGGAHRRMIGWMVDEYISFDEDDYFPDHLCLCLVISSFEVDMMVEQPFIEPFDLDLQAAYAKFHDLAQKIGGMPNSITAFITEEESNRIMESIETRAALWEL